jgi:lipid-binding SYLF domain-containing protein
VRSVHSIPTDEGWLYPASTMDLSSRKIVGGSMGSSLHAAIVISGLCMRIEQRRPKQAITFAATPPWASASTRFLRCPPRSLRSLVMRRASATSSSCCSAAVRLSRSAAQWVRQFLVFNRSIHMSRLSSCCFISLLTLIASGCSTAPTTVEAKADLESTAATAVSQAKTADPSMATVFDRSAACAVFPSVGKGGLIAGGAYGKGVLYERDAVVGYCDLTQGSIGLQAGGQTYTEIISFSTRDAADRFKNGNFAFNAQATAVMLHSGAGANAHYADGVAVFTLNESGLMAEAALGGQKFSYQPR